MTSSLTFQYRKRYEITCDYVRSNRVHSVLSFQYRKRYEITCDRIDERNGVIWNFRFNTASGMRSHVTCKTRKDTLLFSKFQYRKRYEITCDFQEMKRINDEISSFNTASGMRSHVTCLPMHHHEMGIRFNTASGMRSHVTYRE